MLSKAAVARCLERPFPFVPGIGWIDNLKNRLKRIELVLLMDIDTRLATGKMEDDLKGARAMAVLRIACDRG